MSARSLADVLPLSPAQEGLLYHALLTGDGPDPYVVRCRFRVTGTVDGDALRDAVRALLDRHPNLRACFHRRGPEQPVQLIPRQVAVDWTETDLSWLDPGQRAARLARLTADQSRPFDIGRPPLIRCALVRYSRTSADLFLAMHHILIDGWSMPILTRDLAELYARRGASLPAAPPYRDYLAWLRGRDEEAAMRAWSAELAGAVPTRIAAAGARRPSGPGETLELQLPAGLSAAVRRRARESGVTVNTVAQAAWGLTLARMTGSDDVIFGAVVSGRPAELPGVEAMVGLLINTLPVRVRLRQGESVAALLRRLQDEQSRLAPHHHVRLADVQRLADATELFDTILAFENYPRDTEPHAGDGLWLADVADATHYPMTITMADGGERLLIRLSHYPDCLGHAEAEAVTARLVRAFEVLATDQDTPAARLDVLPEHERERLLAGWNETARARAGESIPGRFAAQAARTPHVVAIQAEGRELTYAELDASTNGLAGRLAAIGVGSETPVAVLLGRSPELVIAQLAVLKAGGCYVPLDPSQPGKQLGRLVRECGARVLLADEAPGWLPEGIRVITVAGPGGHPGGTPVPGRPDSAAYVMYTSGSTGTPKGVVATHRNVTELAADRCFRPAAHRRVLLHSPHTFDAATYEIWVPLLTGGTVVIAPPGPVDVTGLRRMLPDGRITALWLTAELFRTVADLAPDTLAGLREVWAGGDVLPPDAVRRVRQRCPDTTVVNGYGPTETTTFATCHRVREPVASPVPIGRPLDNTCAFVLDGRLRPVPAGRKGELYLTGAGLARGYLGGPGLTAERFVAAPHGQPGGRMYRTGDLARWTAGGELEFAGRADDQLKVRGYRVEPGEIEAVLESCPGVHRAVAVARPDPGGGKQLVAYLVLGHGADPRDVHRYAVACLPAHLIPASYVPVSGIPLTAHGKIDRSALPPARRPVPVTAPAGDAPRTFSEQILCDLFAKVLGLAEAGPGTDFFAAGGHSLLAIRLAAAAERELSTAVPVTAVYDAPTPAALSERLGYAAPAAGRSLSPVLTLRAEGSRTPLFCLPPGMGLGWTYTALLPHLRNRPVHALQVAGLERAEPVPESMSELAEDYLARIRAIQPEGPYLLLGRSFGGLLCYEIAARLRCAGQRVGLVAVVDAIPGSALDGAPPPDVATAENEALSILLRQGAGFAGELEGMDRAAAFAVARSHRGPLRGVSDRVLGVMVDACVRHIQLAYSYRPPRLDCPVVLFSAVPGPGVPDTAAKTAAWRRTAEQVLVHELDCPHSQVMQPMAAAAIGRALAPILQEF